LPAGYRDRAAEEAGWTGTAADEKILERTGKPTFSRGLKAMSLLDDDERVVPLNKGASPRQEAEVLASPAQVILDIRRDIQNFQAGGPRNDLAEALRDQFVATRHQAAVKAEATRMLALDMLRERLHEIKSVPELMRVISALSKISENDLAAICGAVPGTGPLLNIQQQLIGHARIAQRLTLPDRQDKESNPIQNASQVLESFELLNKFIKEKTVIEDAIESKSRHIGDQPEPK
jgi:hypothetical protein